MGFNSAVNVRLETDLRKRLDEVCDSYGVSVAVVIRQAIAAKLDEIEKNGKIVFLRESYPEKKPSGNSTLSQTPVKYKTTKSKAARQSQ